MKKILIGVAIILFILIILGVVAIGLCLDSVVKRGVETVGPKLTQTEVKLDSLSLSILSGAGKIKGLLIGNPSGYKSPSAIQVGTASLALEPSSIFSSKVIIHSINVQAPEITFETDLKGNNLSKILANLQSASGGGGAGTNAASSPGKKLQVDDFLISGGKIHVSVTALGTQSATVALPEIHLAGLGQGPDGITPAELTERVLQAVEKEAAQMASSVVADLGKNAAGLTKGLGNNPTGAVESISKSLGGLLQKK
jgi:uncharacterized protein involved in outer membrane biogenesis